jgi:hypothetical protein
MKEGSGRANQWRQRLFEIRGSSIFYSKITAQHVRPGSSVWLVSEWSCREAAGGIPESAREPSPVYPAGRVGTPADPNIPPGRSRVGLVRAKVFGREWTRWTHTGGGKAPAFKPTPNATRWCHNNLYNNRSKQCYSGWAC